MNQPDGPKFRNAILAALSPNELAVLMPHLAPIRLERRDLLVAAGADITRSFFLEVGIASVVATTSEGLQTEVGIIGREGMIDVSTTLGSTVAPLEIFIQAAGHGFVMPSDVLKQASDASATLRAVLLAFAQSLIVQVSYTALAAASLSLKARLARWLLMCHDRIEGDEVPMTHEFLSLMLSVRRPGVTEAVQALEATGAINARRGTIVISDRKVLQALAGESYLGPATQRP